MKRLMIAALTVAAFGASGCAVAEWITAPCTGNCGYVPGPTLVYDPYTGTSRYVYGAPQQEPYVYVPTSSSDSTAASSSGSQESTGGTSSSSTSSSSDGYNAPARPECTQVEGRPCTYVNPQ